MTSANIPEVDTIIASFTNKIPKIQGAPDFSSLSELKHLLGANAAEKDMILGGGANGYLGLILTVAKYNTIAPGTPFVTPIFPGNQPIIPAGATAAQIAEIVRMHTELMRQWKECRNVDAALKKQLINSVDEIYIQSLRNRMNGYANVTARTMLDHLIQHYGRMQPQDMTANIEMLNRRWDPSMPIETLIKQVEDCRDFAEDGNSPIQANTLINSAYTNIFNTGMYKQECNEWIRRPIAEQTWPNFKAHFLEAQRIQNLQNRSTQQGGFHGANATIENERMCNAEALANLATAINADREAFVKLTALVEQLQAENQSLKENNKENRKNGTGRSQKQPDNRERGYCWTHGFHVAPNHNSQTCHAKADGHKDDATKENTMGGSTNTY